MKIVLTNDDGIDAPGLAALEKAVAGWGECVIVAPADVQSGVGHRVTTDLPIRVQQVSQGRFSVGGTPADCSRLALTEIAPDAHWVIAGVNRGGNLGADVYTSGTVAAARESALLGCRAIAVSQYVAKGLPLEWDVISDRVSPLLERLVSYDLCEGEYWNVNLPHQPKDADLEVVSCALDTRPLSVAYRKEGDGYVYRGEYHKRPRQPGRDVDVCLGGKIAVTRMVLDMAGPAVTFLGWRLRGASPSVRLERLAMAHVPVFRTSDVSELMIVKSVLDSEGIDYVVQGEGALTLLPVSTLWGGLGNAGVAAVIEVPEEEAEAARKVLLSARGEP